MALLLLREHISEKEKEAKKNCLRNSLFQTGDPCHGVQYLFPKSYLHRGGRRVLASPI